MSKPAPEKLDREAARIVADLEPLLLLEVRKKLDEAVLKCGTALRIKISVAHGNSALREVISQWVN